MLKLLFFPVWLVYIASVRPFWRMLNGDSTRQGTNRELQTQTKEMRRHNREMERLANRSR
jgi:hypothetical protein